MHGRFSFQEEVLRCWDQRGMLIPGTRPYRICILGDRGSRWKEPSSPSGDYVYAVRDEEAYLQADDEKPPIPREPFILPRSSASSAASPGSRSRCSSRRSGGLWIPTPRRSWQCGSAMSASPNWGRSSPKSPRELVGSTGGRYGPIAPDHRLSRSGPDRAAVGARASEDEVDQPPPAAPAPLSANEAGIVLDGPRPSLEQDTAARCQAQSSSPAVPPACHIGGITPVPSGQPRLLACRR